MSRKQILLTGADGQLGLTVRELWPDSPLSQRFELACSDVDRLDITDPGQIAATLDKAEVELIINAAAYTAVDQAESEPELAVRINGDGARNLAAWAADNGARLIQVSTDFVFDGSSDKPYQPDDQPRPLGAYGVSKLAGERAVQELLPERGAIVRTSWLYSPYQANFVKTMLRLMAEKDSLRVVNDQLGAPTSTCSLVKLLFAIAGQTRGSGIYHWSDAGAISWYDFAVAIQDEALQAGILNRRITIEPIATSEFPTPASRPAYSVLDVSKTEREFGCKQQDWRLELKRVIGQLAKQVDAIA